MIVSSMGSNIRQMSFAYARLWKRKSFRILVGAGDMLHFVGLLVSNMNCMLMHGGWKVVI